MSLYGGDGEQDGPAHFWPPSVADNLPGLVPVRDGKRAGGPALAFSARAWGAFVDHLR
ncbi:DUF397 domain-containing protein [Streptomyces sp. B21-105]